MIDNIDKVWSELRYWRKLRQTQSLLVSSNISRSLVVRMQ